MNLYSSNATVGYGKKLVQREDSLILNQKRQNCLVSSAFYLREATPAIKQYTYPIKYMGQVLIGEMAV